MARPPVSPRAFVVGHPIAHSRSPLLHGHWLRTLDLPGSYTRLDVAPGALAGFIGTLAEQGYVGGNVTVPHKTAVLGLVDKLDEAAQAIGAVNTLWFDAGTLWGGNTDGVGFLASLDAEASGWGGGGRQAVVLGAGGAARAIVHALGLRGFAIALVNRTRETAEAVAGDFPGVSVHGWSELRDLLGGADLLVNTTSLGMAGQPPLALDLSGLRTEAVVFDAVYVPLETALCRAARSRGNRAVNGLGMLLHQAVPGFTRWFGIKPVVTPALRAEIEADVGR